MIHSMADVAVEHDPAAVLDRSLALAEDHLDANNVFSASPGAAVTVSSSGYDATASYPTCSITSRPASVNPRKSFTLGIRGR